MITQISKCGFMDAFAACGRKDQFSYDGLSALYDYLEEYEDGTGQPVELDVIALCCEYAEYEDLDELINDYGLNITSGPDDTDEDRRAAVLEYVQDRTQVIEVNGGGVIILQF